MAERFAILTVVRSDAAAGLTEELRIEGFFARQWGLSHLGAVEVVGLPELGDPELFALEVGRCRVVERSMAVTLRGDEHEAFIDLLDAGEVRLRFGEHGTHRLARRPVSELHAAVNGVTYEASLPMAMVAPPSGGSAVLALEGRGSSELGTFHLTHTLAPPPTIQAVNGEPVTGDYAGIDWSDELAVTWLSTGAAEGDSHLVVSLEALQFDRRVELRCRSRDTGAVVLPAEGVQAVSTLATSETITRLVVQRLARVDFVASGLHEGHAVFAARSLVLLK